VRGWQPILEAARAQRDLFQRSCAAPRAAQLKLLRRILDANAECEFGRTHHFKAIGSVAQYRARVPIRTYEQLQPWLDRIAAGEDSILMQERVIAFEETGGSRAGPKLVPYSPASLLAFRAAVLPWLADLADRRPTAFFGRAYAAVSPAGRQPRSIAGVRVGLASEGAYLGPDLVPAFLNVLAVPPSVGGCADIDEWRLATLAYLLAASDLTIVSVWSPTFFLGLLEAIPALAAPLAKAIRDGTFGFSADPYRVREIEYALARNPIDTVRLWPRLDTVSAWADGSSRSYAQRLAAMLPHAILDSKGLIATEGAVTTNSCAAGPVPALDSTFLEFIDEAGNELLCDELHEDQSYRVVLTTPGGFYRYDLGDRLRCRGCAGALPLLEFIGRDVATDLVGEKLSECFVSDALSSIGRAACLAPRAAAAPHYELLIDAEASDGVREIAATLERSLCANPQYAYARRIGQLGPLTVRVLDRLLDRYMRVKMQGGRLADVKPPVLIDDPRIYAALTNQVDRKISDYQAPFAHA
jgi:GH3 auxin-responsive promoter